MIYRYKTLLTGVLSEVLPQPLILAEVAKIIIPTLCAITCFLAFY